MWQSPKGVRVNKRQTGAARTQKHHQTCPNEFSSQSADHARLGAGLLRRLAAPSDTMSITFAQVIVWLLIGLIGGTLAGALIKRDLTGFGWRSNLGLGLIGALLGGLLFRLFGIFPGLDQVAVSARDITAAVVGSLLFILGRWLWQRFSGS